MNRNAEKVVSYLRQQRTLFLLFLGGLIVLLVAWLLLPVVLRIQASQQVAAQVRSFAQSFTGEPISRKELFIENEPDFVPPFLYYRPPLATWTPEFATQFWQQLDDKTVQELKKVADDRINTLLEAIP
ncbi:hypothetical protein [Gracilinema caldarium]|uniref:hypothetical protein n=1 Tax=Gracilinema caldarium TaxID=215591 RepID=UPI0026EEAB81|nr:hypothetical protein [Gracilinema caldarium]